MTSVSMGDCSNWLYASQQTWMFLQENQIAAGLQDLSWLHVIIASTPCPIWERRCQDPLLQWQHPTCLPYSCCIHCQLPEQCLIACTKENSCPQCTTRFHDLGSPIVSALWDPLKIVRVIAAKSCNKKVPKFAAQSFHQVNPFWATLPHCNIFLCFIPNILHWLHKGVFKDHLVSWVTEACGEGGEDEIDCCFQAMTWHPGLWHFMKGVSLVLQWTGTKYKNMEKIFLSVMAGKADDAQLIQVIWATLDFIYLAHFKPTTPNPFPNYMTLETHSITTRTSSSDYTYTQPSTFPKFTLCNTMSMWSAPMAPQMVSVLRAQRDLILIIPKMLIEQPTKKSISNRWQSGWPVKRNAIRLVLTSHGLTLKRMQVALMERRKIFWMMCQSRMSQLHSLLDILSQDTQHTLTFPSLLLLMTLAPLISYNNLKSTFAGWQSSVQLPNIHTHLNAFKCISINLPPAPQVTKAITKDVIWAWCVEPATRSKDAIASQFNTILVQLDEGYPLNGITYSITLIILFCLSWINPEDSVYCIDQTSKSLM